VIVLLVRYTARGKKGSLLELDEDTINAILCTFYAADKMAEHEITVEHLVFSKTF